MSIEFHFDKAELQNLLGKLCKLRVDERDSVMVKFFKNLTKETELTMKKDILSGQVLKARTGQLRRSIGSMIDDREKVLTAYVGSGVRTGNRMPYANIHETGGIITPKNGKYLTIPLKGALTKSGSRLRGGAFGARDFKDTFFIRSKNGNLLIMQRKGKRDAIPLFVLKTSVTIPARQYMTKTISLVKPKSEQLMDITIRKHLESK